MGECFVGFETGLPELSADFDLAARGEGGAGDGEAAKHGLRAGEDFVAAGAEGDPGEAEGDDSEAETGGKGSGEVDAELGDGRVDEGAETEDEAGDSYGGEDAVAGELELEDDEGDSGYEEEDGGVVDGKEVEAEEAEEDAEGSDGAGDDGAGDVELEIDEEGADDEQEDGEVGAGEAGEEFFAGGGWEGFELGVGEAEGGGVAVEALDLFAVEGADEGVVVGGDLVDEV